MPGAESPLVASPPQGWGACRWSGVRAHFYAMSDLGCLWIAKRPAHSPFSQLPPSKVAFKMEPHRGKTAYGVGHLQ